VNAPIFAPLAQRELRAAAVWMAEDNPAAADALLAAAARGYKRGRNSGGLGWSWRRGDTGFGPCAAFLISSFYDAEAEPPIILRFVHQSRDLPGVLDL